MATAESNIFLNPAELVTEIIAVMEADNQLHREELAKRIANKMLEAARQPAPAPELITRYAGLDGASLESRFEVADALRRRLAQIRGITALLGRAREHVGDIADDAFDNAAWAARDLADEAEALTGLLQRLPQDPPPKPLHEV